MVAAERQQEQVEIMVLAAVVVAQGHAVAQLPIQPLAVPRACQISRV